MSPHKKQIFLVQELQSKGKIKRSGKLKAVEVNINVIGTLLALSARSEGLIHFHYYALFHSALLIQMDHVERRRRVN